MNGFRMYIDTSVVGGCFDEEFATESCALFEIARQGRFCFLVSDLLLEELERAPENVRRILASVPSQFVETVRQCNASRQLCLAYLDAGVIAPQWENDAHHVALATVARADVIVSWNFRHIVHFDKIRLFNAVNLREGYALIDIRSPKEIV